jgi:hypothetical protein
MIMMTTTTMVMSQAKAMVMSRLLATAALNVF